MKIRKIATMRTATVSVLVAGLALGLGACATMPKGRDRIVKATPVCSSQTVEIYFEPFSADVTRESAAVIKAAAHSASGCKVAGVDVLGLADANGGDVDSNLELSKKRAQAVTAALSAAGLPAAEFKVSAAGQAGAVNKKGQDRPLRRRVEVIMRLAPL